MTSSCNCPICSSYLSSHQASLYCAAYALQVTWSKLHHDGNALTLRAVPISNWSPLPVTQSLLVIGQRVTPIALNLLQKDSFWTFKLVRLHITKFPEQLILVARTIRPYCNEKVATRRKETKIGARVRTVKLKGADSYAIFLLSLLMNPRSPQPQFSLTPFTQRTHK